MLKFAILDVNTGEMIETIPENKLSFKALWKRARSFGVKRYFIVRNGQYNEVTLEHFINTAQGIRV